MAVIRVGITLHHNFKVLYELTAMGIDIQGLLREYVPLQGGFLVVSLGTARYSVYSAQVKATR
jgi:hypothetical protein